jgi:hypothetical protein
MGVKVILDTGDEIDIGSVYNRELTFSKVSDWRLWDVTNGFNNPILIAGQFDHPKITKIIIGNMGISL